MASDRQKIEYAKSVLRLDYSAANLDALKTLARSTFAEATDTVTVKSLGFEGGSGSGEITFEKVLLGIAIQELIAEIDPAYVAPPARVMGQTYRIGY